MRTFWSKDELDTLVAAPEGHSAELNPEHNQEPVGRAVSCITSASDFQGNHPETTRRDALHTRKRQLSACLGVTMVACSGFCVHFVLPVCASVNRHRALGDEGFSGRGCLRPSRGAPRGTLSRRGSDGFRDFGEASFRALIFAPC